MWSGGGRVLIALYKRYKGVIAYLFFGVCTTVVNIISYYICAHWLYFSTIVSTAAAWVLAVIFAFVTNKLFVFESRSWEREVLAKEVSSFFLCRAATGNSLTGSGPEIFCLLFPFVSSF